ncbi:MAG: hypothetical protein M1839_002949 [Geoglossum umbratile]|nr:MAG: hypothetical protein M1839_002949 [Geoglossum umbratile]
MGVQIPDGMPAPPESPTALGAVAPKTEVFLCDGAAVQKTPLPQCPSHAEDSNADGFSGAGTVNEADPEKLAGGADLPEEASPAVGTEVPEPPDLPTEGPAPWLVLLGGWCCLFCSFGWINCIGVFQDYYQQHQLHNYSPSAVSWIPSSEIFLMNFCGPIFGKIFDDYGTRYLLGGGSIVHVFGLMMASLSSKYYQFFLAQGFCSAVGASAVYFAAIGSVGTWFCKNRAAAYGVLASGSSLGGVLFPIIVTKLVPRAGFAWAMRAAAFLILALLIVANLTVRSRITPRLKPRFHLQDFTMPLREPVFLVLTAANLMVFLGLFLPFNYIIVEAKENGMSPSLSMYLLSMLNAVRYTYKPLISMLKVANP